MNEEDSNPTEEDLLNPTGAMKQRQLESWTRRRQRGGDPMPIDEVLVSVPGAETEEDRRRQRDARAALGRDRARLEALFTGDFTPAARSQFEERYGSYPADWTAHIRQGEVVYGLNPNNFPDRATEIDAVPSK